jgi:hypothetical protein
MAVPKHTPYCADVKTLCGTGKCERRAQAGSGSRLGNFGKQTSERTGIFKNRLGAGKFSTARMKLGKAKPRPTKQVGYSVEAHHMICKYCYLKPAYLIYANKCGWDIDNGLNCILLPKYCGYQMWDKLQFHKSGHDDSYYTFVEKKLDEVVKGFKKADFCKIGRMKTLHQNFHDLEDELFEELKLGADLVLYGSLTTDLYGKDYKDEEGKDFDSARKWAAKASRSRKPYKWYLNYTKRSPRCPSPSVTP